MADRTLNVLGATNLSDKERAKNDYYGTAPAAVDNILDREKFSHTVWEPTAGHHNIADRLESYGYEVRKSDLVDYGFGDEQLDFLACEDKWNHDILMNPPYKLAGEFIEHALDLVSDGCKVGAFLRLQFLEGQWRYNHIFKENPPARVYVYVKRQVCSEIDDFTGGSAVCYAWYVWQKGFHGDPVIKWIY